MVEFEGQRLPMERVWTSELARIVGPLVSTLSAALEGADDVKGLRVVVHARDDGQDLAWSVRFEGPVMAVNRAVDLLGPKAAMCRTIH